MDRFEGDWGWLLVVVVDLAGVRALFVDGDVVVAAGVGLVRVVALKLCWWLWKVDFCRSWSYLP